MLSNKNKNTQGNKRKGKFRENVEIAFSAIGIALLIRIFVIEAYSIPTGSMIPNLLKGDRLIVNKFIYGIRLPILGWKLPAFTKPARGDMLVFQTPTYKSVGPFTQFLNLVTFGVFGLDNTPANPRIFVKRAIGMPGDIVNLDIEEKVEKRGSRRKIVTTHVIRVNGKKYKRKFIIPPIPERIQAINFESEVMKKILNPDLKQFLAGIYKISQGRRFYVLQKDLSEEEQKKAYMAFTEAGFKIRYYNGTPVDVYSEDNGNKKYKVQYFSRRSIIRGKFYIPREGDVVTLSLIRKRPKTREDNANIDTVPDIYISGNIKININGKRNFFITGDIFETVYNNLYNKIFPENVIKTLGSKKKVTYVFKNNYYFMMGDNRDDSSDSRIWGLLKQDLIIGTPILIYFPFSRFNIVD